LDGERLHSFARGDENADEQAKACQQRHRVIGFPDAIAHGDIQQHDCQRTIAHKPHQPIR